MFNEADATDLNIMQCHFRSVQHDCTTVRVLTAGNLDIWGDCSVGPDLSSSIVAGQQLLSQRFTLATKITRDT